MATSIPVHVFFKSSEQWGRSKKKKAAKRRYYINAYWGRIQTEHKTTPTCTKLAENLWNTFKRLRATWISVEPRSLLVARHDPSTFPKIGSKIATCTFV